jgi:hypothetical protein
MKSVLIKFFSIIIVLSCFSLTDIFAQNNEVGLNGRRNVITSAVPFAAITPDSRSGALGDAGVAISPDANTIHWNPAKLAFMENDFGFGLSYTPWLRNLVPDINLSYLSGYKRINELSGFGGSLRYFSLGDITFTNENAQEIGQFRPYEMAIDGAYARKLSDNLSIGVSLRFIYSNLSGTTPLQNGEVTEPGTSIAGDLSMYWTEDIENLFGKKAELALGANISNIGSKITYTKDVDKDFIPTTLKLGSYLNFQLDKYNELAIIFDVNKLLIPTPPVYKTDSSGQRVYNKNKELKIKSGKRPTVSVIRGIFQSFGDAPGGFTEEMREIKPSLGLEYWYDDQFAIRGGYFYEHPNKGNRQYVTLGAGLRYNVFGLDVSYLVPTNSQEANTTSPLENTIRVSLQFNFNEESQN